jgi:hypothetical protein
VRSQHLPVAPPPAPLPLYPFNPSALAASDGEAGAHLRTGLFGRVHGGARSRCSCASCFVDPSPRIAGASALVRFLARDVSSASPAVSLPLCRVQFSSTPTSASSAQCKPLALSMNGDPSFAGYEWFRALLSATSFYALPPIRLFRQ